MRTLIIIPAYNEARTLASVLKTIPAGFSVLVVDDGSVDTGGKIAEACGAQVVRHIMNRGLGAALRTGFLYALRNGYDAVITMDSDGQHAGEEIAIFVNALHAGADVVIGRRNATQMPRIRQWYNGVGALLTRILFGAALVDTQSGFRALSAHALRRMQLTTSRMEISSEIIAEAHRIHAKIIEVPITIRYTAYSMSKGQNLFEGARTAWRLVLKSFS
jgi:glycosyltransferase involved in cell wall biosynthesis